MKLSKRELLLGMVTAGVVLFGVTGILAKPRMAVWRDLQEQQARVRETIEQDKLLESEREKWQKQFNEVNKQVPPFPAEQKMDVHWLSVMDSLASKHGVSISKRQVGEEKKTGDLYEMSIECKEFEGKLDAIAHFLFDLQTQGAMLDIRQLYLKPKGGGVLKGRFVLYCAYVKEKAAK